MARIAGINLPNEKKVKIGLTYIFGIGNSLARDILKKSGVNGEKRVHELTEEETNSLQKAVQDYKVEGELRREIKEDIQRLKTIGSYRGVRHRRGLPLRGQRTRTNARTKKGKRMPVGGRKKVAVKK
ncbi:MAG: 30S ribosomal protein S13 [Elusimicrobia bacterium]|nr:30S ribosomal protein S13 [Elusimicrobiota bacterium]